ncbi:unnamed protein product [Closterium sp. NIES-53]
MAEAANHTKAVAAPFSIALAPPHAAVAAKGPNSSVAKAAPVTASVAAPVAGEMEAPLIEPSHSLSDSMPAGTRVLLERTSSALFIRIPPLQPAKAALGFMFFAFLGLMPLLLPLMLDDAAPTGEQTPLPPFTPVVSALCALMAVLSVCAAFMVRTMRIDGSQLLHTWQLFDWTIDTTIPTASIVRVSLCKMERRFTTTYFCRVTAADGKQLDFGGHLSHEENVWLQHEVSSYLLSLAAESV